MHRKLLKTIKQEIKRVHKHQKNNVLSVRQVNKNMFLVYFLNQSADWSKGTRGGGLWGTARADLRLDLRILEALCLRT